MSKTGHSPSLANKQSLSYKDITEKSAAELKVILDSSSTINSIQCELLNTKFTTNITISKYFLFYATIFKNVLDINLENLEVESKVCTCSDVSLLKKSDNLAKLYENKSLQTLKEKNPTSSAIEIFNKAICYCTSEELLKKLYINRSKIHKKFKAWKESAKDINFILEKDSCTQDERVDLHIKRLECFSNLDKTSKNINGVKEMCRLLSIVKGANSAIIENTKNAFKEFMPTKEFLNDFIKKTINGGQKPDPSEESNSNYRNKKIYMVSSVKGRSIIAKEDIYPGEVLASEFPYVKILKSRFMGTYCSNCTKLLEIFVPCSNCPRARYCNNECRRAHWNTIHQYTCHIYDYLSKRYSLYLAFCTILKAGVKEIESIRDELIAGKLDTMYNIYNTCKSMGTYRSIFSLSTNMKYLDTAKFSLMVVEVATVVNCMPQHYLNKFSVDFLGCLMIHHYLQAEVNCKYMKAQFGTVSEDIAIGLYCHLSMFNHSCVNNATDVYRCKDPNIKMVQVSVNAKRPIKKGEEITISYLMAVNEKSTNFPNGNRYIMLHKKFGIRCNCHACYNAAYDYKDIYYRFCQMTLDVKFMTNSSYYGNIIYKYMDMYLEEHIDFLFIYMKIINMYNVKVNPFKLSIEDIIRVYHKIINIYQHYYGDKCYDLIDIFVEISKHYKSIGKFKIGEKYMACSKSIKQLYGFVECNNVFNTFNTIIEST